MCDCEPSEPCVAWLKVVCGPPSPQFTSTDHGLSFTPASLKEPRVKLALEPSLAFWFAGAVTTGFAFVTTTLVVKVLEPLSLSKIRPRTGNVPWSAKLQHVEVAVPAPA